MKKGPNKTKAWRKTGEGRGSIASTFIPTYPSYKLQELFVRGMMAGNIVQPEPTKAQKALQEARKLAEEIPAEQEVEIANESATA